MPTQRTTPRGFEFDPVTGRWLVAATVLAAVVLGLLAFTDRGSPRMDDQRKLEKGVTIPNPSQLSPPQNSAR
jgi:hypothetical protein